MAGDLWSTVLSRLSHSGVTLRFIHRYWAGDDPPPLPFVDLVLGRQRHSLKEHTDENLPSDVLAWLDLLAPLATPETRIRHRANMVRWWALWTYGGIWFDHDAFPLVPIHHLPLAFTAALGQQRSACVCAFPVRHPLPHAMLDYIEARPLNSVPRPCMDVSGDKLLNIVARRPVGDGVERVQLPFDARGQTRPITHHQIVHLWDTSHRRFLD